MTALAINLESLRNRVDYQGGMLGFICAVVTILLVVGQQQTYAPIQARLAEDRQAILAQVLPQSYFDNDPLHNATEIVDTSLSSSPVQVYTATKNGKASAFVFQVETEGYGGTITLMLALTPEGEIVGLRTLSHKETPGLADKIETDKSDWILGFNGLSLSNTAREKWAVKKDGGQFDQFTGATITPRAVVKGVFGGLEFYARQSGKLLQNAKAGDEQS
ncbi:electron transport complex subunit RsxG [Teredinibacter turnerae]|uniref:electron transport complex subunit RsxG n=1 Tax=Teredinibacter turnerae TaxID=2426 RepID=UPI0003754C51|nr:electron transport complex subunit RsxG [Teredinibacter turnerae]